MQLNAAEQKVLDEEDLDVESLRLENLHDAIHSTTIPREVGAFDWHESLDRTSLLQDNWEEYVRGSIAILSDPELHHTAYLISCLMTDLYVRIANAKPWECKEDAI